MCGTLASISPSAMVHSGSPCPRISEPSETIWKVVFHLASFDTGTETCNGPRNSRNPETAISRIRMIRPAITCASPTYGPRSTPCAASTRITAATMILSAIGSRKMPSFDTVPLVRAR